MNVDALLRATSLSVPTDHPLPEGLHPTAWGRSGDQWVFWFANPSATALSDALERVRNHVNAAYPTPRPIRFLSVPKMVLVAVLDAPDPAVDEVVRGCATSGWMGGEMFALVSVVRPTGAMVFPQPKGNRNQKLVDQIRLSKLAPDRWARAARAA
jgi:hypothetical protein